MTHSAAVTAQGKRYVAAMRILATATARHALSPTLETVRELSVSEAVARTVHDVFVHRYNDMDHFFPRASSGITREIYIEVARVQAEAFREVLSGTVGERRGPLGIAAKCEAA